MCKEVNEIGTKKQLVNSLHAFSEVYLFGAGAAGTAVAEYIDNLSEKKQIFFLVSDKAKQNPNSDFEIYEISDIKDSISDKLVLVCVMGNGKYEISTMLCNYSKNVVCLSENLLLELRHVKGDFREENAQMRNMYERMERAKAEWLRMQPWPRLQYFVLRICDHCNLNCKGCNHLTSLADKVNYSVDVLERDLKQMKFLHGDVPRIGIMGGEPLLHPEINSILDMTRAIFPKSELLLSTNGILCEKMDETFWEICKKLNIIIRLTRYPIKLDYDELENNIVARGCRIEYFGNRQVVKSFHSIAIDVEGRQDPKRSFMECEYANQCILLKNGRLYTCSILPSICYFNKKFGVYLEIEDEDSIDIYTHSKKEILEFLAKPAPFCRYCNVSNRSNRVYKWGISKCEIEEWT